MWEVEDAIIQKIESLVFTGRPILELGSGIGSTKRLSEKGYKVTSIEHDPLYLDKIPNVNYIYAPIKEHKLIQKFEKNQWYDASVLRRKLPTSYDLILVDGPTSTYGRQGFIKYWDLFKKDVPIIFDDINRPDDYRVACKISGRLRVPLTVYTYLGDKHFGIVDPREV